MLAGGDVVIVIVKVAFSAELVVGIDASIVVTDAVAETCITAVEFASLTLL